MCIIPHTHQIRPGHDFCQAGHTKRSPSCSLSLPTCPRRSSGLVRIEPARNRSVDKNNTHATPESNFRFYFISFPGAPGGAHARWPPLLFWSIFGYVLRCYRVTGLTDGSTIRLCNSMAHSSGAVSRVLSLVLLEPSLAPSPPPSTPPSMPGPFPPACRRVPTFGWLPHQLQKLIFASLQPACQRRVLIILSSQRSVRIFSLPPSTPVCLQYVL